MIKLCTRYLLTSRRVRCWHVTSQLRSWRYFRFYLVKMSPFTFRSPELTKSYVWSCDLWLRTGQCHGIGQSQIIMTFVFLQDEVFQALTLWWSLIALFFSDCSMSALSTLWMLALRHPDVILMSSYSTYLPKPVNVSRIRRLVMDGKSDSNQSTSSGCKKWLKSVD